MNLVLNARGVNSIVVPVTAEIDSIQIGNGTPGQFLTLLFIQDAVGHDVSAGGGNLQGFITPGEAAFDVTAESFTFNSQANTWVNIVPSSAVGVGSFSGDGVIFNNSGSTGAVTATLANAGAHSVLGNPSATAAAPEYTNSPVVADLEIFTGGVLKFSTDTGISRVSAAKVAIGDGTADDDSGTIDAGAYEVGGVAGASGGPFTVISGITVVNGIVTAITGS